MFFFVITKNINWEILTKNLVTFKRWDGFKHEKFEPPVVKKKNKKKNKKMDTFTENTIFDFLLIIFSPNNTAKFVVL